MRSTLCEAVARCHVRRLRKMSAAAPLPVAAVATIVLLAPLALVRIGAAVGGELAGAVGADGVSEALVLGPVLAAAVAGAALAVTLPGGAALGPQVQAGPCGPRTAVAAGLLVPGAAGVLLVIPSLLAACIALAHELPGGPFAGLALAAATVAAVPAGAVVAEGGVAVARGQSGRALPLAFGALGWGAIGAALGAGYLGPFAPVAAALRGSGSPSFALALSCGAALALGLAWVNAAATRAEPRARKPRTAKTPVTGVRLRVPTAVAALLTRRGDVRFATAGAIGFGVGGIAIASASGAPTPSGFLLATTTALLGSILCPLAVCGILLEGSWLWRGGAGDRRVITCAAGVAGLAGSALPVAVVGGGAAAVSGSSWSAVGVVAAFTVVGSAVALLAGAVMPWRGEGVGDQVVTFTAFVTIAIAASLLIGIAAPRLVALGLPDVAVAAVACGASIGVALHALGRRLGEAAR